MITTAVVREEGEMPYWGLSPISLLQGNPGWGSGARFFPPTPSAQLAQTEEGVCLGGAALGKEREGNSPLEPFSLPPHQGGPGWGSSGGGSPHPPLSWLEADKGACLGELPISWLCTLARRLEGVL